MSEQGAMLDKAVGRLFADLMGEPEEFDTLWRRVADLGVPALFLPEEEGGFNGGWSDAGVVFRRLGLHALPLPVGETVLALRWLRRAGAAAPEGAVTLGLGSDIRIEARDGTPRFSGTLAAVPWGARAPWLLTACRRGADDCFALLSTAAASAAPVPDMAGEGRVALRFSAAPVALYPAAAAAQQLLAAGALLRAGQMAGALQATLQLAVEYANGRTQFGRAIGKFQAIQQQLAVLAEEAAAVDCAARAACDAADGGDAALEIAAAKLRANRAAAKAGAIAHQVHGAIGFTREHPLHRFTLRLLAWRGDFGNDRHWAQYLGRLVCRADAGPLWHQLTARDERAATAEHDA